MSINTESFIERLHALTDVDSNDYLVNDLYDLCFLVDEDPDSSKVVPHIFAFFEAHPNADFGTPGPLVHLLEKQANYEKYLVESVARKPMFSSIQMINRILNSNISSEKRASLIGLLENVSTNPAADENARDHAERLLQYQRNRLRQ